MRIKESFLALRQQWRISRIEAARQRLDHLLATTPRYWTAAAVGGLVGLECGQATREQAIEYITNLGHEIAHIDLQGAFIVIAGEAAAPELPPGM